MSPIVGVIEYWYERMLWVDEVTGHVCEPLLCLCVCVCDVQWECCFVAVNEWGEKHSLVSANSRGVKCWLDMMYAGTEGVVIRREREGKTLYFSLKNESGLVNDDFFF